MIAFLGKWLKKKEAAAPHLAQPTSVCAPPTIEPVAASPVDVGLELSRYEIIQRTWGEGFNKPGTARFIVSITGPMQLDPSKTMLDLQAGSGGSCVAVADAYKTWVTGFERDVELVKSWKEKTEAAPEKSKYYQLGHYDPATFDYQKRADGILARELLYTLADKKQLLKKMTNWLKPKGHLVLTDFVAEKSLIDTPPVAQWVTGEKNGVNLVSAEELAGDITTQGFDLRVSEDITESYQREVCQGLDRLSKGLEGKRLSSSTKVHVAEFAEFWARRVSALGAGVKFLRYYAIKKG